MIPPIPCVVSVPLIALLRVGIGICINEVPITSPEEPSETEVPNIVAAEEPRVRV